MCNCSKKKSAFRPTSPCTPTLSFPSFPSGTFPWCPRNRSGSLFQSPLPSLVRVVFRFIGLGFRCTPGFAFRSLAFLFLLLGPLLLLLDLREGHGRGFSRVYKVLAVFGVAVPCDADCGLADDNLHGASVVVFDCLHVDKSVLDDKLPVVWVARFWAHPVENLLVHRDED